MGHAAYFRGCGGGVAGKLRFAGDINGKHLALPVARP